ncbi:MAG: bacillithiol biosynthesis BshC [Gemmatimonadota bacterium]
MTHVRILTEALGGSPLSRLIQTGDAPPAWVGVRPRSAAEWRELALARRAERDWGRCWDALAPAIGATGAAAERLERVRQQGGVVVTTGQQPGLFGGPVYTWSKALGALAFADALERETGVATAAVFWAATDDADFDEAAYTVLARAGGAEKVRSEHAPPAGTPMSLAPLGDVSSLLTRLRDSAGSIADPRALEASVGAYADPRRSVGEAYVALLRELLAPLGIPVIDASHAAVQTVSRDTLASALTNAGGVAEALSQRGREMRAAGFEPQVEEMRELSLVFAREAGIKRRLSIVEAAAFAADERAVLTPNVLLRPLVERAILPTLAYLGGPGELAYFAQVSAVADALGVERPLALPRWSCTLIEPHVQRLLDAFGVGYEALAQRDALEGAVARKAMSERSAAAIGGLREAINGLTADLSGEATPLGLDKAVEGARHSLQHRVDRLERRLVAGIKRREQSLLQDVGTLRAALYPLGTRQERALNLIPMLSRHGLDLLDEMRDAAGAHAGALVAHG